MTEDEVWRDIEEFPRYMVSNLGQIYNKKYSSLMVVSYTLQGHAKIALLDDYTGRRRTMSVACLVASAFVDPPDHRCDCVIVLDGHLDNVKARNLAWRPRGFAWEYAHQLNTPQPLAYQNLHVANITQGITYKNIMEAGISEGVLFRDIWRSTFSDARIYPHRCQYRIVERV